MKYLLAAWLVSVNGIFIGLIIFGILALKDGTWARAVAFVCVVVALGMLATVYGLDMPAKFAAQPVILLAIAFALAWKMK